MCQEKYKSGPKKGLQCEFPNKEGTNFCGIHQNSRHQNSRKKKGQNIKNRAGSSRNGFATSVANNSEIIVTEQQVLERDNYLGIEKNVCFYCNQEAGVTDHLIPSCNTTKHIYGSNNELNYVPSCAKCNGSKGGKVDKELEGWLKLKGWNEEKIIRLRKWIIDNKEYIYLSNRDVKYIEETNISITKFHVTAEECVRLRKKVDFEIIKEYINNLSKEEKNEILCLLVDKKKSG